MGITLAKALQYCTPFTTDNNREIFGYGYIDGDKVYATNTHACIECTLNGDNGQQLMPLSKKAMKSKADPREFSVPNYPRVFNLGDDCQEAIILEESSGLKPVFRLWKDAFSFCKKLPKKGEFPRCVLETTKGGVNAYAVSGRNVAAKFLLYMEENKRLERYEARCIYNADYMIKICNVLIDLDPVKVIIRLTDGFKKVLVETEDMRIILSGMKQLEMDPLIIFYESEKYLK